MRSAGITRQAVAARLGRHGGGDGGAVASCKIERRERPAGVWALVSLAMETEATRANQDRGKDWEYCGIAVNKAGEGLPSNTVAAVV